MTKKSFLSLIMALSCAICQPMAAKSFDKTMNDLLNQLLTAGMVVGGSYFLWMLWDTSSREQQVKTDKLYLRNIKTKLINVPLGSWYDDNSIGCVDATRNRFWINWRIIQDPMGRENSWKSAKDLKDAGAQNVVAQLKTDLRSGRIICQGYGLNDRERQNLNRTQNGLALAYYDIATEVKALKVHLSKFLRGIVQFSKAEYLRAGGLEGHVKTSAQGIHQGLRRTVTYLNECTQEELNQIGTGYSQRLPVDTNSWWYEQELKNCKLAISYYWKLLTRYVRLFTLKQLVASQVAVGQRREPSATLFTSTTVIPPYTFVRKNWSAPQRRITTNNNIVARNRR